MDDRRNRQNCQGVHTTVEWLVEAKCVGNVDIGPLKLDAWLSEEWGGLLEFGTVEASG